MEVYRNALWKSWGCLFILLLVITIQVFTDRKEQRDKIKRGGGRMPLNAKMMIAVAAALVCIYMPGYLSMYPSGVGGDAGFDIRPYLLSLHNTLRTFILDGDAFDVINPLCETVKNEGGSAVFQKIYSVYTIGLYILAPILTFGTVLSYFSDFVGILWLFFAGWRPLYVMSELNERSSVLADSILNQFEKEKFRWLWKRPVIVYMNNRKREDVEEYLMLRARRQHAVLLRKEIDSFYMGWWYHGRVELFLIGDETRESQNVSQAVSIVSRLEEKAKKRLGRRLPRRLVNPDAILSAVDTEVKTRLKETAPEKIENSPGDMNTMPQEIIGSIRGHGIRNLFLRLFIRYNVGVFVFATKKSSAAILDSVDYGTLLKVSAVIGLDTEEAFRLRRVDDVRELAWKTVSGQTRGMRQYLFTEKTKLEGISVLMVGLGRHGLEFLKFLLWYCQMANFRLQITLIDKKNITEQLEAECPELMAKNRAGEVGDGVYDIRCLDNTDLGSKEYYEYFEYAGTDSRKLELRNRLQKTNVALVALGDDDLNIQTSLDLRAVFDRANRFRAMRKIPEADELLQIFTIVYDAERSTILEQEGGLINYREIPYNIHFCGSIQDQYSYDGIFDRTTETEAFAEHIDWAGNNLKIWMELSRRELSKDLLEKLGRYDPEELKEKYDLSIDYFDYMQERMKYERFEYFRLSSIARVLHARLREDLTCRGLLPGIAENEHHRKDARLCTCACCRINKMSEHMRWNVYMRAGGYRYGPRRDRALNHNNLIPFDRLDVIEQAKDCNCKLPGQEEDAPSPGKSDASAKC